MGMVLSGDSPLIDEAAYEAHSLCSALQMS